MSPPGLFRIHPKDPGLDFGSGCFGVLKIGTGLRGFSDTGSGNSGGEL